MGDYDGTQDERDAKAEYQEIYDRLVFHHRWSSRRAHRWIARHRRELMLRLPQGVKDQNRRYGWALNNHGCSCFGCTSEKRKWRGNAWSARPMQERRQIEAAEGDEIE